MRNGYDGMGRKILLDERGRITIPNEIRLRYGLLPGDDLELEETENALMIRMSKKPVKRIKGSRNWNKNAFLNAGEATFEE